MGIDEFIEPISLPLEAFTSLSRSDIESLASYKIKFSRSFWLRVFVPIAIKWRYAKRAGLARALSMDPSILFLDEPSAGLDPINSRQLDELIDELKTLGLTFVVVTHELKSIFEIADDAIFK